MLSRTNTFVDFELSNHGSIQLFVPCTEAANEWFHVNVQEGTTYFGRGFAVETRFAPEVLYGVLEDGLIVTSDGQYVELGPHGDFVFVEVQEVHLASDSL